MYIVVEGEDPGFDIFVNGRALARYVEEIEKLALSLKVRPLIDFFSADETSMSLLIEEGAHTQQAGRKLLPPQWYFGSEGLETIEALIGALSDEPHKLGTEGPLVLEELEDYQRVLRKTEERGLRWHLAVSWR